MRLATIAILCLLLPSGLLPAEEPDPLTEARKLRSDGDPAGALEILEPLRKMRPDDPELLYELGLAYRAHAQVVLQGRNPTIGRLALADSLRCLRRVVELRPDWPDALRALGHSARSNGELDIAVDAFGRAAKLDPKDGESRFWLGHSLAYLRRPGEAVEAFTAAENLLGPQPRILQNIGAALERLGRRDEAMACFRRLFEAEVAAGRAGSPASVDAVQRLWRGLTADGKYDRAEAFFSDLAAKHPGLSSPTWYVGYARWKAGKAEASIEPFRHVVKKSPTFAEAHRLLTLALAHAGRTDEAVASFRNYRKLDSSRNALSVLLEIADWMVAGGKRAAAIELLARMEGAFPEDPRLIEGRADFLFAEERYAEARTEYLRAAELDPFSTDAAVKAEKAVTVLLRRGDEGAAKLRVLPEERRAGKTGVLYDFEGSRTFARLQGGATGGFDRGAFRIRRRGDAGSIANLTLSLIPTTDTRSFRTIRFTVRGRAGESLQVMAKDCYDEFGPSWVRLWHADAVALTGEKQTVTLALDRFETPGQRKIPFERARLRAVIFELGIQRGEDRKAATEVVIDDVALADAAGGSLVLADFEEAEDQTVFVTSGAASAFARTLFTVEQAREYRPDPNTYVSPAILGADFAPGLVRSGEGAFRMALPSNASRAAALGTLTLDPARSARAEEARAIVFWARGATGGEMLRVVLRDALDDEAGGPRPAAAPRLAVSGAVLEGHFVLEKEWKRFRIPRRLFPDVAFGKLATLEFRFGTPEGNEPGTTLYLDDIGWE